MVRRGKGLTRRKRDKNARKSGSGRTTQRANQDSTNNRKKATTRRRRSR